MSEELSRRERKIVDVLFASGEASADEVREAMGAELANATEHVSHQEL